MSASDSDVTRPSTSMTDPMDATAPGDMEPCKLCGVEPKGKPWLIRYTVRCCKQCQEFFRKHDPSKPPQVRCPTDGNCDVSHKKLKKCTSCRYTRALEIGMSNNAQKPTLPDDTKCLVCGGKAKQKHYGVVSCEKCRCFFRRVTKDGKVPSTMCTLEGRCALKLKTKKLCCKGCRYRKCVEGGMRRDQGASGLGSRESTVEREMAEPTGGHSERSNESSTSEPTVERFILTHPGSETAPTIPVDLVSPSTGPSQDRSSPPPNDAYMPRYYLTIPFRTAFVDILHDHTYHIRPILCQVCADEASHIYYGVDVCSPCRLFFVQQSVPATRSCYSCRFNENCDLTTVSCSACRYKRCIELGMTREGKLFEDDVYEAISGPCKVCNAEGIHSLNFGIWTCTSCEEFFRENDNVEPYVCLTKGVCDLDHRVREACKACRMSKSLCAGMRRLEDLDLDPASSPAIQAARANALLEAEMNKIAERTLHAHQANWDYTTRKVASLSTKPSNLLTALGDPHINRLNAWQLYSYEVAREFQETTSFIRNLPRIQEIGLAEQASLLTKSYFFVYLVRIHRGLTANGLMLYDGRLIDPPTLELLFGAELSEKMLNFARVVAWHQLTDNHIAAIVMCLLFREAKDSPKLVELGELYMKIGVSRGPWSLFEKMIPDLEEIKKLHDEQLNFLRKNVNFLSLSPIFMEVFNIQTPVNPLDQQYQSGPSTSGSYQTF